MIPIGIFYADPYKKSISHHFFSQIWTEAPHPVLNLVEFATSDFSVFYRKEWQICLDLLLYVVSETKNRRCRTNSDILTPYNLKLSNNHDAMCYLFDYFVVVQHVFSNMPSERFMWLLSRSPLSCPTLSVLLIPRHGITLLYIPCVWIWRHRTYYYKEHMEDIGMLFSDKIKVYYIKLYRAVVLLFFC